MLQKVGFATAKWRVLPNFIIIGAQKAGTTSLLYYLNQHPQVERGIRKEIHFFDFNYQKGENWYRAHFPFRLFLDEDKVVGEATPHYLFYPYTAKRIAEMIPDVKLIVLLRNPVKRAISHYFHSVGKGREPLSMYKAMINENDRTRMERKKIFSDEQYRSDPYRYFSYKERGIYINQLKRYFLHFPMRQILFIKSEEFFTQTEKVLEGVFTYLNIQPNVDISYLKPVNVGENKEKPPQGVIKYLEGFFDPYNQRLYERLGKDFNW